MKKLLPLTILCGALAAFAFAPTTRAQTNDGSLDPSFHNRATFDPYPVFGDTARQADGKVIVDGDFTGADGLTRTSLARFNTDGTLDRSWDAGIDQPHSVRALIVQPDGKLLVAGGFTSVRGARHYGIVRLNTDGSVDSSFVTSGSSTYYVNGMALQPDGKIVIAGTQSVTPEGSYRNLLVRLNANGSEDSSFKAASADYNAGATALALQADGKVLVATNAYLTDGTFVNSLTRVNSDGTADAGFVQVIVDYDVYTMATQPDGKIVIGGDFTQVAGTAQARVARLNVNGSVDTAFRSGADASVVKVAVQADGKIYLSGFFFDVGPNLDHEEMSIARFNADGSPDPSFHSDIAPGAGGAPVNDFVLLPDLNRILIAGGFTDIAHDADYVEVDGLALLITGAFSAPFFDGETPLGQGVFYLYLPNGNRFGYYSYLSDRHYIYHFDLGYEYVFDAADGQGGIYLYDFKSNGFFYTSQKFPFPYLYDFSLNSTVYYYPDPTDETHYNTNGMRYFYVFNTGQITAK